MTHVFLSHTLSDQTPGFGGKKAFQFEQKNSIKKGDSNNSQTWTLSNHIGTHIDAPYHFDEKGKKINELEASFWIFKHPHLITLRSQRDEIIQVGKWTNEIPDETDLLLIKTGFETFRNDEAYWRHNPGLSSELGEWLRRHRKIRALGFDFISLTAFAHREEGRIAHRAFLAGESSPILIIEDMKLSELRHSPLEVIISPIRVEDSDGAPVTVLARVS